MAVKASERVKRYQNPNGPTISTVERKVIEQDGLYFKDIDGTGTVSAVNDWRLTPAERAEAYVKVLTTSEKIGQIFTSDWRMGPKYPSPRLAANGHKPVADESGLLDEAPVNVSDSIFGSQSLPRIGPGKAGNSADGSSLSLSHCLIPVPGIYADLVYLFLPCLGWLFGISAGYNSLYLKASACNL